ncbi:unnamed protein product [Sphacelaria rigidula]
MKRAGGGAARSHMYEAFKQGSGRQPNAELMAAKALAKTQREGVREHAASVNEMKRLIDDLRVSVRKKREKRPSLPDVKGAADDVMDEEEFQLVTREREAKRAYKEAFDALAKSKEKMEASSRQEEVLRKDLLDAFDTYCEAKVRAAVSEG